MNRPHLRLDIVPLALPIFMGMLVFQIQVTINRAFLGQVEGAWLAVISNVVFSMWATLSMLNALATGATIVMSHSLGASQGRQAKELAVASVVGNTLLGFLLLIFWATSSRTFYSILGVQGAILDECVAYTSVSALSCGLSGLSGALTSIFLASSRTGPIMISGIVRSLLNIVLDYLLIFGSFGFPHLGLIGAAVASLISDFVGTAILLAILFASKDLEARPDRAAWRAVHFGLYRKIVWMGLPTSVEDLLWSVGNLVLIAYLNRLDPLASAVYGIVFTIEILPIVFFISLGQGSTVLVGRAKGAGEVEKSRGVVYTAQILAWMVSLGTVLVFLAAPRLLVGAFTSDGSLVARAAPILLVSCFTFFPRSVNFMAGSGIRGLGHTKWMLGTQIFGTCFVALLGYLLVLHTGLGVIGLFLAMCADEFVRSVMNAFRFQRLSLRRAA